MNFSKVFHPVSIDAAYAEVYRFVIHGGEYEYSKEVRSRRFGAG
jgi:hypothetical protein